MWNKPVGLCTKLSSFSLLFSFFSDLGFRSDQSPGSSSAELEKNRRVCTEWAITRSRVEKMDEDGWRMDKEKSWKMTGSETPYIPTVAEPPSDSWRRFTRFCPKTTNTRLYKHLLNANWENKVINSQAVSKNKHALTLKANAMWLNWDTNLNVCVFKCPRPPGFRDKVNIVSDRQCD